MQTSNCRSKTLMSKANNNEVLSKYSIVSECDPLQSISGPHSLYRVAEKSLARPERKQAAPVKSVMGRGIDWFG